jgi:hypothetical protein
MNDERDELEQLLGDHLRRRLDPHIGRAPAAFDVMAATTPGRRRGGARRIAIATAGLIAAAVAVAWVLRPADDRPVAPVVTTREVAPDAGPREIERLVLWRTIDDGSAVVGDRLPVRKLRHEAVEQVQYYDPQQRATIRVTVPVVRNVMVQMETY